MRKGMQLPINTMVGLAVAVVVLLAIVAFFMSVTAPTSEKQVARQKFSNCCVTYVQLGCRDDRLTEFRCTTGYLTDLAAAADIQAGDVRYACGCIAKTGDDVKTGGT
ncbi:MAG: DUF4006 family protein, partial [Candidatus Aenigmarchaeota archaeon]|nr:DUF4006 family protein [Candidatus Aenigmarchaeota archaeon]